MARVCFVVVAGLDRVLMGKGKGLGVLGSFGHVGFYEPVFPAVTCTMQATLTTGVTAAEHGIVCNGVYTHGRAEMRPHLDLTNHAESRVHVSFWEQANSLLQAPRFWAAPPLSNKKVAMLFWQNSMPSLADSRAAAEVVLTPKPVHTGDGKTLTACWSQPAELYGELVKELGAFPLHKYWSPMAGIESSEWIVKAAVKVWEEEKPDLELVYIPHMDFNLMRTGPEGAGIGKDLAEVDRVLGALAKRVREEGGVMVVAGDYGMSAVTRGVMPNLALRDAGFLATRLDAAGKVVMDYEGSRAFVMCDHQVGHVYVRENGEKREAVVKVLEGLAGVARVLKTKEEIAGVGLGNARSGDLVMVAEEGAWFGHDWWREDVEKPGWQFGVDIHNKPGFDPRELFFDPPPLARKCIAQDASLVKGSHGVVGGEERWPVVLSDVALPKGEGMRAVDFAGWLRGILEG